MDTFTIYFDTEDLRRMKGMWLLVWCLLGINFFYHSWRYFMHIHGLADWILGTIQLLGGVAIIVSIIVDLYLNKKYGRPCVVFSNEGLEIKARRRGHAKKISWDEIQTMHLKINGVEIIPKAQPADPIEIPAGSCSYTQFQQIKKNLKEYSAKYRVESNF